MRGHKPTCDLNGTLYMRGPTVNYSVENVASFDVEDVEI